MLDSGYDSGMGIPGAKPGSEAEEKILGRNAYMPVEDIFNGVEPLEAYEGMMKMYADYADAMARRGREGLEEVNFVHHFFEGGSTGKSVAFGGFADGFLLGEEVNGVFVPTHFAPVGIRGGYRLVRDLVESDIPTALFITGDLVATIRKMEGWKVLPVVVNTTFRGEKVEKIMVVNRWDAVGKLAEDQAKVAIRKAGGKIGRKVEVIGFRLAELKRKASLLLGRNDANADDLEAILDRHLISEMSGETGWSDRGRAGDF